MSDERGGFPSASGLHRVVECRGSWGAERGMPETSIGDDWRDEGSTLHDFAEKGEVSHTLSDEQQWALRTALDLKEKFYEDFDIRGEVFKEKRLWAHKPNLTPLFSGKFDEAVIAEYFASICDYKFGRKPVPPARINVQMLSYAVLLWLRWPGRERYAVAIIQPRVEPELRFSAASYTPDELEEAYQHFLEVLTEADEPGQPRTPSYHACEYCRALHVCPDAFNFFTRLTLSIND